MKTPLVQSSAAFLGFLDSWVAQLPELALSQALASGAGRAALLSVDVINGFCYEGPLSSPRVAEIVEPITRLMRSSWEAGLRHILLTQDTHEADAVEFANFPPHCIRGTREAETVDAYKALPFYDQMVVLEKNSIHSSLNTGLNAWLAAHPEVDTFLITGDCTDLCTYQLAMHLRLDANARQLQRRVILPVDCVETYDRPVAVAQEQGGLPHDADLMHAVFLYHLALNGVEVVSKIV